MRIKKIMITSFILSLLLVLNPGKVIFSKESKDDNPGNSSSKNLKSKNLINKSIKNDPDGKKSLMGALENTSGKYNDSRIIVKFKKTARSSKKGDRLARKNMAVMKSFKHLDLDIINIPSGSNVKDAIEELKKDPEVEFAEPDYVCNISTLPNDPKFNELWGLNNTGQTGGTADADIDAAEAWDITTGNGSVVVGVIDTGVDYTHEDLNANMWVNPGEIAGNGIDDDGNGVIDDIHGYNAVNDTGDPMDDHSHGTHVSGTIGAAGNNGVGVAGVNWNVKIMALKFLDSGGSGWTSGAVACIDYILAMKSAGVNIRVTSNSWGGGGFSQTLYDAISGLKDNNILFVAAAGNSGSDNDGFPHYPSNYDLNNVISVAATDKSDNKASWSCYGKKTVDVGAPGVDILSSVLGNSTIGLNNSGTYKLIYFGFGFEGINGSTSRNSVMSKVLNYYNVQAADQILIVDDDRGSNYESYYKNALTALGFTNYDVISVPNGMSGPQVSIMSKYKLVIWFTGNDYSYTLTNTDQINLANFLDNGGNLFITGQDIGYNIGYSTFYKNYLMAEYKSDAASSTVFSGFGIFSGETINLSTSAGDGARNQIWVDVFRPVGASTAFSSSNPYAKYSGTSMATPHVSGLAALIGDYRSELNYKNIKQIIFTSVDKIDSLKDKTVTDGRINMLSAINKAGVFVPANELPVAEIGQSMLWSMKKVPKTFNGSLSFDPDGDVVAYHWDFGDGATGDSVSVKHVYESVGTYTVKLTVTDDEEAASFDTAELRVCDYEITPDSGYNTVATPITIKSSGGNFDTTCKVYIQSGVSEIVANIGTNSAYGIYKSGNYAYVADYDSGLQIVDISNPNDPKIAGNINTSGYVYGVYVSGDYAYVADYYNGLQIIDIKDPNDPKIVGSVAVNYARGVYVSGDYAYVADYSNGLKVIDVKDPANPSIAGSVNISYARGVFVSGNYAYVAGYYSLKIVDISSPDNPSIVGSLVTPDYVNGVYVSGIYAYLANNLCGLQVVNISNPSSPVIAGNIDTPGYAFGVYVSGNNAYVADYGAGLQVIDISDPDNLNILENVDTPGEARGVFISENYVYIADSNSGLEVIEVVSGNKSIIGSIDTPSSAEGICISGNYAYIADNLSGLQVVDISNPLYPNIAGSVDTPGSASGVFVSGNYAYIADWNSGLQIADISNPNDPIIVGSVNTPGGAYAVYVKDNYAYIADFDSGLQVIDISNPANPIIVGKLDTSGYSLGIYISGNYAYLADYYYGLQIINISDPLKPYKTGSIIGEASGVYVSGNYAYVSDYEAGLRIINVSNPSNPALIGSLDTPGSAYGVYVSDNYAYIADFESGLQVVNVSDSTVLKIEGTINTPGEAYSVVSVGNYFFVADGRAGLQILNMINKKSCDPVEFVSNDVINAEVPKELLEGAYNIKITNSLKEEAIIKKGFTVVNAQNSIPHVVLLIDCSSGKAPLSVNFTANASNFDSSIVDYKWDFNNDGFYDTVTTDSTVSYIYGIPGNYKAKVKVEDNNGAVASASILINVINNPPVISSFSSVPASGKVPLAANFIADASDIDGNIVDYKWDYNNDGIYDSVTIINTFSYIYGVPGSYTAKVKVTDNNGAVAVASLAIDAINNPPVINSFSGVPTNGNLPLLVNFNADVSDIDGSIVNYKWDFNDDGNYDTVTTNKMASHTYTFSGSYMAKVKVTDNNGGIAEAGIGINVINNLPVISSFSGVPTSGGAPLLVNFTANASDTGGNIVDYNWDFNNDGSYDTVTITNTVSYTYNSSGSYTAKVKVADNEGAEAFTSIIIDVTNISFIINDFSAVPASGNAPLLVNFTAVTSGTESSIVDYKWDFNNDGIYDTVTTDNIAGNTYIFSGSYTAKVKVTDDNGEIALSTTGINVINNIPEINNFINDPISGNGPLLVHFAVDASDVDGSIVNYKWDFFNDGNYDTVTTVNTVSFTYSSPGSYTAKVKVTDNEGGAAEASVITNVFNNLPVINSFSRIPASGYAPLLVNFTANASDFNGSLVDYEWDFNNDGIYDTVTTYKNVSYTYSLSGSYTAKVKVTDNEGGVTEASIITNVLNNLPVMNSFIVAPSIGKAPLSVNFTANASDIGGSIVDYKWDFNNDGIYDTVTTYKTVSYIYNLSGSYTAKVKVTDNEGAELESVSDGINVINNSPVIKYFRGVLVDYRGILSVKYTVNASDSDGSIINYKWDFNNDGNYETSTIDSTIIHNYITPGSYPARVKVTDNNKGEDETSVIVEVNKPVTQPVGNIDTASFGSNDRVDGNDLFVLAKAFGSKPDDSNFNTMADLDNNDVVDGNDLILLAVNFGK